jgi:hypothetical protein
MLSSFRSRAASHASTRHWLGWLVVACASACGAACATDAGEPGLAENRGVEPDGGAARDDAGASALLERVSNVGTPCSLLSHSCRGAAAQCLEISYSGAFYAGGYCTADCKSSAECGPGGECPVGDAESLEPDYDFRSTWARKCFKSCQPGALDSCRAGYACMSLADAYAANDAPAPLHRNVCIPRLPGFGGDAGSLHAFDD